MKFLKEEGGTAVTWIVVLLGLAMFGLFYAMVDPFMNQMLTEGVNSGIPSQQQTIQSNVWAFLPLAAFGAFVTWGLVRNQRSSDTP